MRRPEPEIPPPDRTLKPDSKRVTQVREYELITPLYGGGVEPGKVDPITPIHGTGIRGHLRFWWRATQGGKFNNLRELREAEEGLWGATSRDNKPNESRVLIAIEVSKHSQDSDKIIPFEVVRNPNTGRPKVQESNDIPSYSAFPLRPEEGSPIGTKAYSVWAGIRFTLITSFPADDNARKEVEAALWAWETFGGIGARTRRGFGAIRLRAVDGIERELPTTADEAYGQIVDKYKTHVQSGTQEYVPLLVKRFVVTEMKSSPMEAWVYLVGELRHFRQGMGFARNERIEVIKGRERKMPGRSRWPEPDAIRRLTGRIAGKHATPLLHFDKFPRAAFGLPIIFHFKKDDVRAGDPHDTTLKLAESERLASPLILRPLACADGKAVGLAVVLKGTSDLLQNSNIILKDAPGNPIVRADLDPNEAKAIRPLGHPKRTDVLLAFLDHLKRQG